jgi:hypothetical protein
MTVQALPVRPEKFAVDRGTATIGNSQTRIEVVQIMIEAEGVQYRFIVPKEDAILIGMALTEAAHDAKRIQDVKIGVTADDLKKALG